MSGRTGQQQITPLVNGLAAALREHVLPELGSHAGRAHAQTGQGGDVTFAIDEGAEELTERYIAQNAPAVAFYSEDRGLVMPSGSGEPEWVLIVDPIDGTRPAMAGLESACVSVAAARLDSEPTMADVVSGCVIEIKSGAVFSAERGRGCSFQPLLSRNEDIARMFWVYGLRGRPVRVMAEVLGGLVDASSVGGGTFDLGSATFNMTRVANGQLDAYIETGSRIVHDHPRLRAEWERLGGGQVLNTSPYDLAASVLICEAAGAVVTDAYGRSLAPRPLLGSGNEFQMSCVTAANHALHERIIAEIDAGVARLG